MKEASEILIIIQTISSIITPVIVVGIGIFISNKIEKNKLVFLKEKEWQVKWAELFFAQAVEFNSTISSLVCNLHYLQTEKDTQKVDHINKTIYANIFNLLKIAWDIQNYVQFSHKYGSDIVSKQEQIIQLLRKIISEKKGDLEELRRVQFEYNKVVRSVHAEMLH